MKKSEFREFYDIIGRNPSSDDVIKNFLRHLVYFGTRNIHAKFHQDWLSFVEIIGGGPIAHPCVPKQGLSRVDSETATGVMSYSLELANVISIIYSILNTCYLIVIAFSHSK